MMMIRQLIGAFLVISGVCGALIYGTSHRSHTKVELLIPATDTHILYDNKVNRQCLTED